MDKYLNNNIKNAIESLTVCQGTAKESGNPYWYLSLKFINGYEKRIFLNDDSKFAVLNAIETIQVSEIMNEN